MEAREVAYAQLLVAARRSPTLRLALETWAVDGSATELAWTSRLALRELELADRRSPSPEVHWLSRASVAPLSPEALEVLEQQLELGPPRRGALLGGDRSPFGEVTRVRLLGPREFALPEGGGRLRRLSTYSLEVQPEGVSLTVRERSSRGEERRVYASASLELLLEEHPELRDTVPDLEGLLDHELALGTYFQWKAEAEVPEARGPLGAPALRGEAQTGRSALALRTTAILGVKCTPLSSVPGTVGLLGPGVGLVIERRLPGTIASELGLRRGEVLVELNGEPLCRVEEISRIIERAAGGRLELKILDLDGLERSLTWSPAERPQVGPARGEL